MAAGGVGHVVFRRGNVILLRCAGSTSLTGIVTQTSRFQCTSGGHPLVCLGSMCLNIRRDFSHSVDRASPGDREWKQTTQKSRGVDRMRSRLREKHGLSDSSRLPTEVPDSHPEQEFAVDTDFYGISDGTLGKVQEQSQLPRAARSGRISKKFSGFLKRPMDGSEKVLDVTYGFMRLDKDNIVHSPSLISDMESGEETPTLQKQCHEHTEHAEGTSCHDQDPSPENKGFRLQEFLSVNVQTEGTGPESGQKNYIEEQFFPDSQFTAQQEKKDTEMSAAGEGYPLNGIPTVLQSKSEEVASDNMNLFDENYFGPSSVAEPLKENGLEGYQFDFQSSVARSPALPESYQEAVAPNFFEEQYFPSSASSDNVNPKTNNKDVSKQKLSNCGENMADDCVVASKLFLTDSISQNEKHLLKEETTMSEGHAINEYHEPVTKQEMRMKEKPKANVEHPQTAYDMAMKIRLENKQSPSQVTDYISSKKHKWPGKLDTKGFKILKDQVLHLDNYPEDVVVKILKDSIIFDHEDILALDKPYGLACHGGPGIHHSVGQLLPKLAQKLSSNLDSLYLVHRLDKETTGVMLLAKTEEMAWRLHRMFRKRQVVKKYWLLTKGVPNPPEGVIDIPMGEGSVGDRRRMALRPNFPPEAKLLAHANNDGSEVQAITNYKILDSYGSCALVECQPETGVKHQIRCHLAFGLNTPILGDHKYSHFSRLVPQRLYPDMLQRLGIRQATVRYLPMHLHAKQLILPELYQGRNLFISARLPKHFVQNMKWLKIRPPK